MLRRRVPVLVAACATLAAWLAVVPASSAEGNAASSLTADLPPPPPEKPRPPPAHLELGARLVYGRPLGEAAAGLALGDEAGGLLGLAIDAGIRLPVGLFLGAYVQWASVVAKKSGAECPADATGCGGTDVRLGLEARWHFLAEGPIDPFVGIGVGREWLTLRSNRNSGTTGPRSETDSGWEYAQVQLGAAFRAGPRLAFGPVVTATLARFANESYQDPSITRSGSITNPSIHGWLMLGLEARVGIW